MMALTLHQPWASLIAAGAKSCETRHWAAARKYWGDVIAIHAGRVEDREFRDHDPDVLDILGTDPTPKGAIVAIARLKDCIPTEQSWPGTLEDHFGDFSPGRFAWRFADVQPLSEPVPCRGHHKLWTLPHDIVPIVMAAAMPAEIFDPHDF